MEIPPAILQAQNLYRVLGSAENPTVILKGVDVSIRPREYVSIVGASGSGKSTLLYLLGGLDRPSPAPQIGNVMRPTGRMIEVSPGDGPYDDEPAGPQPEMVVDAKATARAALLSRVFIDGQDTADLGETDLARLRNEKCGFVFQFHYLLKEFTAAENVALPMLKLGKLSRRDAIDKAVGLLKQFGLADKATRRANRLSGGEQQRVAIARALANDPAVLLADEPTGNLDRKNGDRVAEIFDELGSKGQAIVMVTHDTALARRAGRMITMEDGKIIADERKQT